MKGFVDMNDKIKLPLEGLRVVELATVVAAPTASRMLCAYGAEVIKVETLYGDELRRAGRSEMCPCEDDKNPLFTISNSSKKLTSINFKSKEGKEALLKLIGRADIFITNVREASLKRNGLDYESLKEQFPSLIYAHFSGYGPDGPAAAIRALTAPRSGFAPVPWQTVRRKALSPLFPPTDLEILQQARCCYPAS